MAGSQETGRGEGVNNIKEALRQANKLGARGIEVVDYTEPTDASQGDSIVLITRLPQPSNATELAWWEKP